MLAHRKELIPRVLLRPPLNDYQSRFQLGDPNNPGGSFAFRVSGGDVLLEGDLGGDPARMHLVRQGQEVESFLLLDRGFHWVSETPFNR